jgi:hypothetical protein
MVGVMAGDPMIGRAVVACAAGIGGTACGVGRLGIARPIAITATMAMQHRNKTAAIPMITGLMMPLDGGGAGGGTAGRGGGADMRSSSDCGGKGNLDASLREVLAAATGLPHAAQKRALAPTCVPQFEQNLGEMLIANSFQGVAVAHGRSPPAPEFVPRQIRAKPAR